MINTYQNLLFLAISKYFTSVCHEYGNISLLFSPINIIVLENYCTEWDMEVILRTTKCTNGLIIM